MCLDLGGEAVRLSFFTVELQNRIINGLTNVRNVEFVAQDLR